jgi:hypothetical protein
LQFEAVYHVQFIKNGPKLFKNQGQEANSYLAFKKANSLADFI